MRSFILRKPLLAPFESKIFLGTLISKLLVGLIWKGLERVKSLRERCEKGRKKERERCEKGRKKEKERTRELETRNLPPVVNMNLKHQCPFCNKCLTLSNAELA